MSVFIGRKNLVCKPNPPPTGQVEGIPGDVCKGGMARESLDTAFNGKNLWVLGEWMDRGGECELLTP